MQTGVRGCLIRALEGEVVARLSLMKMQGTVGRERRVAVVGEAQRLRHLLLCLRGTATAAAAAGEGRRLGVEALALGVEGEEQQQQVLV